MSITAVGENWQDAVNEDQSPMHILTPLTVSVDVYKCIIANTNLPKYTYNITHLSDADVSLHWYLTGTFTFITFTYRPSLVKIDARNFELSW